MLRLSVVVGLGILGLTFLVGIAETQDTKRSKGQLPAGWKNLQLSPEQLGKIYGIQGAYKAKINELKKQMKALTDQEKSEMVKVLTDDQKTQLVKLVVGSDPGDKKTPAKKTVTEEKK
jgi:hypothetical protein